MARRRVGGGPIHFYIELTPEAQSMLDAVNGFQLSAVDWTPLWPRLTDVLIDGVQQAVATRGASLVGPDCNYAHRWLPPTDRYARRKAAAGKGGRDLFYDGTILGRVLTHRGVLRQTEKFLTFGLPSEVKHARYMNFKARPFLGDSKPTRQALGREMQGFLRGVIDREFGRRSR